MHTLHRNRHHINLRIERWHRRVIYAVLSLLALSGAAWLVARFAMRPVGQFGETVHPLEPLAMKVHGGAAMVTLFFVGSLMNAHIRRAIKAKRNLAAGWSVVVAMLTLIVSGYALYYVASEESRPIWSATHWILGLAGAMLFVVHVIMGRRLRPA
ncbi:MAG TPA: DUF4405 domain-containing protein [Pseudoduganella sp.]